MIEGTHKAKIIKSANGVYNSKAQQNIRFMITAGECQGEEISWSGDLEGDYAANTARVLTSLGWAGETLTDVSHIIDGRETEIAVKKIESKYGSKPYFMVFRVGEGPTLQPFPPGTAEKIGTALFKCITPF